MTLQQLAETTDDPREALLLFIASRAPAPVTKEDALACYRGELKRMKKYLADLLYEGSIGFNQSGAIVYLGWHRMQRRRFAAPFIQLPIAFPDDLMSARALVPESGTSAQESRALVPNSGASAPFPAGTSARDLEIDRDRNNSNRIESKSSNQIESKSSNQIESIERVQEQRTSKDRASDSARGYIEEKLCLPKLQRLRIEIGKDPHMSRKFIFCLHHHPDRLAEWVGECATAGITDPVQFLSHRMTHAMRSP